MKSLRDCDSVEPGSGCSAELSTLGAVATLLQLAFLHEGDPNVPVLRIFMMGVMLGYKTESMTRRGIDLGSLLLSYVTAGHEIESNFSKVGTCKNGHLTSFSVCNLR